MEKFKSGFVSIIGRTNVGKSTLINSLLGEKVAITANKSQTTRTVIKAIINNKNSQIIFTDTPGIHKPKTKLGTTMNDNAWSTIPEVDIILFIVEATSNGIGKGDQMILEKLKESNKKAILVINKIDLIEKEKLLKLIDLYNKEFMTVRGKGKYTYNQSSRQEGEHFFKDLMNRYFPNNKIIYFS